MFCIRCGYESYVNELKGKQETWNLVKHTGTDGKVTMMMITITESGFNSHGTLFHSNGHGSVGLCPACILNPRS